MPSFGTSVVTDISSAALDYHVRGSALLQTQQERPLLRIINETKETFPSGVQYVTEPVQGVQMSDQAGFFAGYNEDDQLNFKQSSGIQRAQYPWKEVHAGFVITFTELKKDGITVTDAEQSTSDHGTQLTRLTALLQTRLNDFSESWARSINEMYWRDGSQDSKQTPGLFALLQEDPTTGTVGSISQATYSWWRSRYRNNLVASAENQTLSKFFRNEVLQLKRYGGKPSVILCGSVAYEAIMAEVERKGNYTQTGFADKNTDVGIQSVSLLGVGRFDYDPTLDSLSFARRFVVLDRSAIRPRPMAGEENKTFSPSRPYQYMLMLKSMVSTQALTCRRLSGCAMYDLAV